MLKHWISARKSERALVAYTPFRVYRHARSVPEYRAQRSLLNGSVVPGRFERDSMTETAPKAKTKEGHDGNGEGTRRDFLYLAAGAVGGVGAVSFAWPFVRSMNPSRDVLALSTTTVDISAIEVGQAITVEWQKKPVFIRRRTEKEITDSRSVDVEQLPDQETDEERAVRPEWLVIVGVCTHLGCIPLGNKSGDSKGEFDEEGQFVH